jgi:hypothetical protein
MIQDSDFNENTFRGANETQDCRAGCRIEARQRSRHLWHRMSRTIYEGIRIEKSYEPKNGILAWVCAHTSLGGTSRHQLSSSVVSVEAIGLLTYGWNPPLCVMLWWPQHIRCF